MSIRGGGGRTFVLLLLDRARLAVFCVITNQLLSLATYLPDMQVQINLYIKRFATKEISTLPKMYCFFKPKYRLLNFAIPPILYSFQETCHHGETRGQTNE